MIFKGLTQLEKRLWAGFPYEDVSDCQAGNTTGEPLCNLAVAVSNVALENPKFVCGKQGIVSEGK